MFHIKSLYPATESILMGSEMHFHNLENFNGPCRLYSKDMVFWMMKCVCVLIQIFHVFHTIVLFNAEQKEHNK